MYSSAAAGWPANLVQASQRPVEPDSRIGSVTCLASERVFEHALCTTEVAQVAERVAQVRRKANLIRGVFRMFLRHTDETVVEEVDSALRLAERGIALTERRVDIGTLATGSGARTQPRPQGARPRRCCSRRAPRRVRARHGRGVQRPSRRQRSRPRGSPGRCREASPGSSARRSLSSASASRSSRSSTSRRSDPVSRYSTETPSFRASCLRALTEGRRASASIREM